MFFCNINFNILNKENLFILNKSVPKCIVTVNAQIIRLANINERYLKFINNNFATFDGEIPLRVAKWKNNNFKNAEKLSGSEFVYDFCSFAEKEKLKLFFLGGKLESNKMAVQKIRDKYDLEIEGYSPEYEEYPFTKKFINECKEKIGEFKPDILFIAFGAPKQEYFAEDNLDFLKSIGVKYIIGCGGTFEFVSGQIKRAPKWIQDIGLESLYRLCMEFNKERIKRIIYSIGFFKYIG